MRGRNCRRYEQFETSPETIEQELRPAVCEQTATVRFKENYSLDEVFYVFWRCFFCALISIAAIKLV